MGNYFEDTTSALANALEHFDKLLTFSCVAVVEAKGVLNKAKSNPQAAAEGAFDKDLKAVRLLVEFQSEARTQPERFKARWEAAKAHPRLSEVGIHLGSLETVEYRLAELNLKQVVELRALLDILRVSPPQLTNPVIPWHSPEKTPYRQSVEAYYLEETNLLPSLDAEFYDVQNDHFLVDELIKAAAVLPVKMYITSPERRYVETFKVGNYDHCEVTLGTTIHRIDIGKDGKKNVVYAKGVIL